MVGVTDTYDVLVAGSGYKMYDIYMRLVGNDTGKVVFGTEKWNKGNSYGDVNDDGVYQMLMQDVVLGVWIYCAKFGKGFQIHTTK